jgi:hypothetical protein
MEVQIRVLVQVPSARHHDLGAPFLHHGIRDAAVRHPPRSSVRQNPKLKDAGHGLDRLDRVHLRQVLATHATFQVRQFTARYSGNATLHVIPSLPAPGCAPNADVRTAPGPDACGAHARGPCAGGRTVGVMFRQPASVTAAGARQDANGHVRQCGVGVTTAASCWQESDCWALKSRRRSTA